MKNIVLIFFFIACLSCKKYLEVEQPRSRLSRTTIFTSDATATAAQLAIYSQMESQGLFFHLPAYTGLAGDEFRNHSTFSDNVDLATNNLTASNQLVNVVWTNLYRYIYQCNSMLEGLAMSSSVTPAVKEQLEGEARFIRAFCYYYLTNLYGPVPLVTSTDYTVNSILARNAISEIYTFVTNDLLLAKGLLSTGYKSGTNTSTTERVRPNKWTAAALLARVYLHLERWSEAEAESENIISSQVYSLSTDLNNSFLKSNPEAIFQLMAVVPRFNSFPGANFILSGAPSIISIAPSFLSSFRTADKRQLAWTKSINTSLGIFYYPYKYKVGQNASSITEFTVVFRLAEQFLIRAEARAMQNKLIEGIADLNTIRQRAGLSPVNGLSQASLLDSIHIERKFELMFETGDRWINLNRIRKINEVLGPLKGSNWNETDRLFPIPQTELLRNPNMSQNPGY
ncbi:MAG: RagB/SusD family nutrient uptake outer membrane protein [Chitinophagaceae bacterium]|nr:RagB/SusD family nutrient uptake outer membrane protein [Chitinophagaceae bacterium]